MTVPRALAEALQGEVAGGRRVGGGCINDGWMIEFADGRRAFVKTRQDVAAGEYATEAAALRWLAEPGSVRVPEVLELRDEADDLLRLLALEWVEEGRLGDDGAEELGRGLAALHAAGAERFGALPPGAPARELRVGPIALGVEACDDWPAFYAEQLLRPLARRASDADALSTAGAAAVERVCERIGELAGPPEAPARLHGDLWGGNVLADSGGRPWLIDPAAYGGHREVDLAMLRLFGAPSGRVFDAYAEAWPLAEGHGDRVGLWQLFPLLVHAVLFGGGYGGSAEAAALRYAG